MHLKKAKKMWVQWLLAVLIFFCFSWLYMGKGITSCSYTSVSALGGDSTGGLAWEQWAGGNDFSWGTTNKSNYPFGEKLDKPQAITSTIFVSTYKLFSVLTTPICGLNLIILLGYLSTAVTMFGLIKWLLKRFDIAIFAGYAAAFVPFHIFKSQSHINYIYSSIFIGLLWSFLWLLSKPTYTKAAVFAAVSAVGFYFDGYFILISGLMLLGLVGSQAVIEVAKIFSGRRDLKASLSQSFNRFKYIIVAGLILAVLLLPILLVFRSSGSAISQSLASVRSDIKTETLIYGARPIELVLPAANNPLMPASYGSWHLKKIHGSNNSESTLYVGFTVMILALVALGFLMLKQKRQHRFRNLPYRELVFTAVVAGLVCFAFSLPAHAYIFGHNVKTPTLLLVKLTANWRVLSRTFLAIDSLFILLASFGLYWLTRGKSRVWRLAIVGLCGVGLFLDYLPSPLNNVDNLYKDAPPIYQQLAKDDRVKLVAEYPLADFSYTPSIFTFQPVHQKILVNANDGSISRGPFDSSIAGLNDDQTIGALKSLQVDEIITHGFQSNSPMLTRVFSNLAFGSDGSLNKLASSYAYKFNELAVPRPTILVIDKGYESLYVDTNQISHRYITSLATMSLHHFTSDRTDRYAVNFTAIRASACAKPAQVSIVQAGQTLWSGSVGTSEVTISFEAADKPFTVQTTVCSISISQLSAQ